MVTARLDKP
jgi:hypothetical protein